MRFVLCYGDCRAGGVSLVYPIIYFQNFPRELENRYSIIRPHFNVCFAAVAWPEGYWGKKEKSFADWTDCRYR